jgi:hypothetical protein
VIREKFTARKGIWRLYGEKCTKTRIVCVGVSEKGKFEQKLKGVGVKHMLSHLLGKILS